MSLARPAGSGTRVTEKRPSEIVPHWREFHGAGRERSDRINPDEITDPPAFHGAGRLNRIGGMMECWNNGTMGK
jgi:hypothetical protein